MASLRTRIPMRPTDAEPIDVIPVLIGAVDLGVGLSGWLLLGEAAALEASELSVVGAVVGNYLNLGSGYVEAKSEIRWRELSRGYSLGVVMGADGVSAAKAATYFGHRFFPKNEFLEGGAQVAADAYKEGLVKGYADGKSLSMGQRRDLWSDLRHRAQSLPGWFDWSNQTQQSAKRWSESTWKAYYGFFATVFRKFHVEN